MRTCILCNRPIFRPQLVRGGPVAEHWNCTDANKIAPPLPTPIYDSIRALIIEIAPSITLDRAAEFGSLLGNIEEDKYQEERGNPAPAQATKQNLENFKTPKH